MNPIDPKTLERMIHTYILFHSLSDTLQNVDQDLVEDAKSLAAQTLHELTNQYLSTHTQDDLESVLKAFDSKINPTNQSATPNE